ncbi:MAG: tRNA 2-thiouridine(34) synthase MnmA [Phascolarctobacterium sp.]|nr:tRNA 2-thiouridine(34) synthase MnmA [Phascolarctobacterium sp.]
MNVLVAMSGGVDSSTSALLLKQKGYNVTGITARMFHNADVGIEGPDNEKDIADAKLVAEKIGIPHHVVDLSEKFKEHVIRPFTESYAAGITPNPCVTCNRHIKFGALLDIADSFGCDFIATGHYAEIEHKGRYLLKCSDPSKDQSYMLFALTQEQLSRMLFPVGDFTKDKVRELAGDLPVAQKKESQNICFTKDYAWLLSHLGIESFCGDFLYIDGTPLGKHKGQIHYTIGQRKGLGVAHEHPLYVVRKDLSNNTIILGPNETLYQKGLIAGKCNFIKIASHEGPLRVNAKIRYRQKAVPATIEPCGGKVRVIFDEPQRAITPGQATVFYDGDYVVGGGIIEEGIS